MTEFSPSAVDGGGGVNCVVADRNVPGRILFAGDVMGGGFTDDKGRRWLPRNAGAVGRSPACNVAVEYVDPDLPNVIYRGIGKQTTGEQATGGVERSDDDGLHYSTVSQAIAFCGNGNLPAAAGGPRSAGRLMVKRAGALFAASFWPQGIYKSVASPFGNAWALHALPTMWLRCLVGDPANANSMIAGLFDKTTSPTSFGLWRVGTDGSQSQFSLPGAVRTVEDVWICPTCGRWYLACNTAGLCISPDGGTTFQMGPALPAGAWCAIDGHHDDATGEDVFTIGCTNPSQSGSVFASLAVSTDGGATVSVVSGYSYIEVGLDIPWWQSQDSFGLTKMLDKSGAAVHMILNDPDDPARFFIAAQGGVWLTEDTGVTVAPAVHGLTLTAHRWMSVNPLDPSKGVLSSDDWTLFAFQEHASVIRQQKPLGLGGFGGVDHAGDGTCYLGIGHGAQRKILFSADPFQDPNNWTDTGLGAAMTSDPRWVTVGSDADGHVVVLATSLAGAWRYFWNGTRFASEQVTLEPFAEMRWPGKAGPVVYGVSQTGVWKSIDYGHSWFRIMTIATSGTVAITCDAFGHLYLATSGTLYRIGGTAQSGNADVVDSGATVDNAQIDATQIPQNCEDVHVRDGTRELWVATVPVNGVGGSLLSTPDFGATWVDRTDISYQECTADLDTLWVTNDGWAYVGTNGQGASVAQVIEGPPPPHNEQTLVEVTVTDLEGNAVTGNWVLIETVPGQVFDRVSGASVLVHVKAKTDEGGRVQVPLIPTGDLLPAGSLYRVTTALDPDHVAKQLIQVPETGGPYNLDDPALVPA